MKINLKSSLIWLSFLQIPLSHAGWISSGGEDLKEARNPWFLKNTRTVSYCIKTSPEEVSVSMSEIQETMDLVLQSWKQDLAFIPPSQNGIGLLTQEFVSTPCAPDTDIVFQFGYETLSAEQRTYLGNTDNLFAVAVRTSYDEVHLRGRGFVFVNSDLGPHRFRKAEDHDGVWKRFPTLASVLAHEFGHILGLPHKGSMMSLMNENFPKLIIESAFAPRSGDREFRIDHFTPAKTYFDCFVDDQSWAWFGLPIEANKSDRCVMIEFEKMTAQPSRANVYRLENDGTKTEPRKALIGEISFENQAWQSQDWVRNVLIKVELNPKQQVFPRPEKQNWIAGPVNATLSAPGKFHSATNGAEKSLRLKIGAMEDFELLGVEDGKIIRVLKFML